MPTEISVTFPSDDVPLEGRLTVVSPEAPVAVICHPHPNMGGSMDNNVVDAVREAAVAAGVSAVRFNLRGVGRSGGHSTGELVDARDVGAAVDYVATKPDLKPAAIYLVGYSYGAWVGLFHAVGDGRIGAWAAVSPPTGMLDFSYLVDSAVPKLFVTGDSDYFVAMDELKRVYDRLPGPKRLVTIRGADHFYWGMERALAAEVEAFLRGLPPKKP